jgi:hypothetical protein
MAPQPSTWRGWSEQNSLDRVGWEARKIPAEGDVFFLDFSFYRTYRDLVSDDSMKHAETICEVLIWADTEYPQVTPNFWD